MNKIVLNILNHASPICPLFSISNTIIIEMLKLKVCFQNLVSIWRNIFASHFEWTFDNSVDIISSSHSISSSEGLWEFSLEFSFVMVISEQSVIKKQVIQGRVSALRHFEFFSLKLEKLNNLPQKSFLRSLLSNFEQSETFDLCWTGTEGR